ncbi:MAG: hypothetical protein H5T64_10655 [Chloroflexi bacterium]|nr:hypothetical protein [Chloroflexota bacterium]
MEEEIDLREYVAVLVKHWKAIVAVTAVAAIAALVVSLLLPPTYEATAICVATKPKYQMQFDPKIQSLVDLQVPSKAYAALAKNAELERGIIETLGAALLPQERTIEGLQCMLTVSTPTDPSVIQLKARSSDPQKAALLANTWAELFVQQINELYGQSLDEQRRIEGQLAVADQNLKIAEDALIEFQKRSQIATLQAQIEAELEALSSYLAATKNLELVIQDAQSLKENLQMQGAGPVAVSSGLSTLFLEIDSLNSAARLPVQLQIPIDESIAASTSISQQVQYLDNFMATLKAKQQAIAMAADEIPARILELQGALQREQTERDRLARARDVARETYLTLSRKADEVRIATQVDEGELRIVSQAEAPREPVAPKKGVNTAIAGVLGLMVGVLGAFAVEYFEKPRGSTREAIKGA